MSYDVTKIWDGESAQVFIGAGDGVEAGLTGPVSIIQERQFIDVTASQTGAQILDRRETACHYRVSIAFKTVADANWFKSWWFDGHPDAAGVIQLHRDDIGGSMPTKRMRLHPRRAGVDKSHDIVFEKLVFNSGPTAAFDGRSTILHTLEFLSLPDPSQLPSIKLGHFNAT